MDNKSQSLEVSFAPPSSGWITVRLSTLKLPSLPAEKFAAEWHTPFPELEMTALTKLVGSWKE
jgi:hypothetical protein